MNRTYIDELPFLEDVITADQQIINGGLNMIPSSESGKIKKFIRNTDHNIPIESGMNTKQHQEHQQMLEDEHELVKQQQMYEEHQRQMQEEEFLKERPVYEEKRKYKKKQRFYDGDCDLNCISVADHAANCIVCSKLYTNDKTLYLSIIGVLIIICIILMKKIMEK